MTITIIYNKNYSDENFPSKFMGGEEVKIIKVKECNNLIGKELDAYINDNIKPLDIVKLIWELPKGHLRKKERYFGHAFIYLGWDSQFKEHKICHSYSDQQNGCSVIKISDWENSFWKRFFEEKRKKMIIIHRPKNAFKNPDTIIKHIAKCVEGKDEYFREFGEIKIKIEKKGDKANDCGHFTNRCVLGLDFSELVDIKLSELFKDKKEWREQGLTCQNGELKRIFNDLNFEINESSSKIDGLTAFEQQRNVDEKINRINKYKNQAKIKFEAKVVEKTRINGYKVNNGIN